METGASLRQTKKDETRNAIFVSGLTLFLERGFDAVSVVDIAAAAHVSKMTVFNYFPAKEDIFFLHADDVFPDFAAVVRGRRKGETIHRAMERYLEDEIDRRAEWLGLDESAVRFERAIRGSVVLTDAVNRRWAAARDELLSALRTDGAAPRLADDLAPVITAQLIGTIEAIGQACHAFMAADPGTAVGRAHELCRRAFAGLRP